MKIFSFFFVLIMIQCERTADTENLITKIASFKNQLPVDGCDWHFSFKEGDEYVQLAPSDDSKSLLDPFIKEHFKNNNGLGVDVTVTYLMTGKKKNIQCGWGKTTDMPEIVVKSIVKN